MRILHLLSQTELTGAETYAAQLIDLQARDGMEVFVISDKIHTPMKGNFRSLPIATRSFWQRMKNILILRSFLKEKEIQVIHCHSRGAVRHAFWARMFLPIGLTTSLHGEQHFSFSKKIFHLYGEVLIAVCENIKVSMLKKFGTPASVIRVIRNPVSAQIFPAHKPSSSPRLALAGRSSGPKGLNFEKLALGYFKIWLDHIPDLKISVIAPQPENFSSSFQDHVFKLQNRYPGQIDLVGEVKNLSQNLQNFDLVICSGRIAIETLLCERKLLAMGEFCSHGLIDLENYHPALATNFGDIGADLPAATIDYPKVAAEVLRFFQEPEKNNLQSQDLKFRATQDFSVENIHRQVLEVYKGALFKRQHPAWIPILMYHKVPDKDLQTQHRIFVTKKNFARHLDFFKKQQFETLTFRDLLAFWDLKKPMSEFPQKPLLLTFDDGYLDNLTNVQPLLREREMKAVIFLLADHQLTKNTWDEDTGEEPSQLMNLEEKKKLDPDVFEVGSHGFHHIHLTQNRSLAFQEMQTSKVQLEEDLNTSVISFAYPYGSSDLDLAEKCFLAGYRFAVNTDQGGLHMGDHPRFLFRVNIFPEESLWTLWKKTSVWYRKYFYRKRGQ